MVSRDIGLGKNILYLAVGIYFLILILNLQGDQSSKALTAQIYLITIGLKGRQIFMFPELWSTFCKCGNYSLFCLEIGCALSEALEDG